MTTISKSDLEKRHDEVFNKAQKEPVVIQEYQQNSYVILSFENYSKLQERIQELEDYKMLQEMTEIKKNKQTVSETIENNIRSHITKEYLIDPL